MARINIDDELRADPRFHLLCSAIPRHVAFGVIVCLWELGQVYWKRNKSLIPPKLAEATPNYADLLQCGLIEVREEGIYCSGAEERWGFLLKRIESGRTGGLHSAQVRLKKYGSAVPLNASNSEASAEANAEAKSEALPKSPKPSSSSSSSEELNTIGHRSALADLPEGFEDFWIAYPRKLKRTEAMKRFKQVVKPSELEDFRAALRAFKSHHATARTEIAFVPYPTTFLGTKAAQAWRDWLAPSTVLKREHGRSDDELASLNALAEGMPKGVA